MTSPVGEARRDCPGQKEFTGPRYRLKFACRHSEPSDLFRRHRLVDQFEADLRQLKAEYKL